MYEKRFNLAPGDYRENVIEVKVIYDLGGWDHWNSGSKKRGYYLIATPCLIEEKKASDGRPQSTFTHQLGRGLKILLKEVSRKSKKAEDEANKKGKSETSWLLRNVCDMYGYKLVTYNTPLLSMVLSEEFDETDEEFLYQMLDRLRTDCDYFLGAGNRQEDKLWGKAINEHIAYMFEIYDILPVKPDWLDHNKIEEYERNMKEDVV